MSLTFTAALRANKPKRNVGVIAAANTFSGAFSLAIQKNGRAWGWGYNYRGALGDNSISMTFTPVSVAGAIKTFCQISGGYSGTVAIDKNGRAWGWGANGFGEIGDNTNVSKRTPVSVVGAVKTFCKINIGGWTTCAIDKNGRAWTWGYNFYGQLGNNTAFVDASTPVSVAGAVKTFCHISCGGDNVRAIDKNGRAWGWGRNYTGEIGDNTTTQRLTPVSVLGAIKTFCQIAATSIAIDKNGIVWGWGNNSRGQLGDNSTISRLTPVSVLGTVKTFCKISSVGGLSLAIDKNGRAWGWGYNRYGQIGDNSTTDKLTPVSVLGAVKTFCEISAGSVFSLAIDKNGRAWGWGFRGRGRLGDNLGDRTLTPVSVYGATRTFCKINGSGTHSFGIDKNGIAWGWGYNTSGQLGDNSTTSRITPVSIVGTTKTFCEIDSNRNFTLAIDKNGRAWTWGSNVFGQLGDNTTTQRLTPVSVLGAVKTFCKIDAAYNHSVALDKNGRVWGWGANNVGQLGDNSTTSQLTPVSVLGAVKTFCQITSGGQSSYAIDKNGRAWSWGFNTFGQLGDNTTTQRLTPVSVAGAVKTFCWISANHGQPQGRVNFVSYVLALDKDGRAWGWGNNIFGQLGDNSVSTVRYTPVSVAGTVKTFCKISAGSLHTLAIDKNGRVWAWGYGNSGQLGSFPQQASALTPVSVAGAVKTFCHIRAGGGHSLAIDKNGRAWGWGYLTSGQLGIIFELNSTTPVRICNI